MIYLSLFDIYLFMIYLSLYDIYLFINYLTIHLFMKYLSPYLSYYDLFIYLFNIYMYGRQPVSPVFCRSIYDLSIYLFNIYLFIYDLYVWPSTCLPSFLSIYLSVYLFILLFPDSCQSRVSCVPPLPPPKIPLIFRASPGPRFPQPSKEK